MKKLYSYISALGVALLFHACESDLEKTTYDYSLATPAVLENIESEYVLENAKSDEIALELKWSVPEMNYSTGMGAAVTNNIEIDLAGKEFANKAVLAAVTGKTTQQSFKHGELNSNILKLLKNSYNLDLVNNPDLIKAYEFEIRIESSIAESGKPIYSNILKTKIIPFSTDITYPEIYVIGNYSNWNWDQAQSLFSFKEDDNYEGVIDFGNKAAEGFKLTGAKSWETSTGNWGPKTEVTEPAETGEVQLINDGGSANIKCYSKRFYRFNLNTTTLLLQKTLGFDVLSICGDAGEEISDWGAKEKDMEFDPVKQRFYADVKLSDGEIKFRADHDWGTSFGSSTEGLLNSSDNIKVKAGNYRIYVNLNNSSNQTYELSTEDFGK
jgi:hypothetical protein